MNPIETASLFMGIYIASMILYRTSAVSSSNTRAEGSVKSFLFFYQLLGIMLPIILLASIFTDSPWLLKIGISRDVAAAMRVGGWLLAMAGFVLFVLAKHTLKESYSPCWDALVPKRLVTQGIYSYIRHPIYTSNLVIMFGAFLATTSLYMALFTFVMWLYYMRSTRLEEASLVAAFGPEYESYQAGSGRFLPR